MDDLISRKALMKKFSEFVKRSNNSDFAPTPTWNDAVSLVESMPSADVPDMNDGGHHRHTAFCGGNVVGRNGDYMTDSLISRQAAIELVDWYQHEFSECDYAFGELANELCKLPSAQPKKGKWIDNETSYFDDVPQTCTCSVCGMRSRRPIGDFCKWCGADMRGGK